MKYLIFENPITNESVDPYSPFFLDILYVIQIPHWPGKFLIFIFLRKKFEISNFSPTGCKETKIRIFLPSDSSKQKLPNQVEVGMIITFMWLASHLNPIGLKNFLSRTEMNKIQELYTAVFAKLEEIKNKEDDKLKKERQDFNTFLCRFPVKNSMTISRRTRIVSLRVVSQIYKAFF